MDGFEIVAPGASGEAVFSGFTLKWLLAFKMDKMVTRGRLSIHLREVNCPKNGERVKTLGIANSRKETKCRVASFQISR